MATIESDRTPRARYKLYGNDSAGIPFRLKQGEHMPHFKSDDQPHRQPQEVMDAHAQVFDLGKPSDLEEYNKVIDMVAKNRAQLSKEELQWNTESNTYMAFLRWVELFIEQPQNGVDDGQTLSRG